MKRIPFLRRPITHKFKRPHSKAEEPDCLSLRNPPSIMITTQSLSKGGIGGIWKVIFEVIKKACSTFSEIPLNFPKNHRIKIYFMKLQHPF
jgi:hypothetical protein